MAVFLKVVKWIAKYGKKAISWAWKNKWRIIDWGLAAYEIISEIFG